MTEVVATNRTILVVGGGISGLTAALEAAETGKQVVLVEKRPFVGGRITQLYKYFPKLCYPTCGLEINQRRAKMNPNLTIITMAQVTDVQGEAGDYTATVKISARYVNGNCTGCGDCARAVEREFDSLVLATTNTPEDGLTRALADADKEVHSIGDTVAARTAHMAIYEGRKLGLAL